MVDHWTRDASAVEPNTGFVATTNFNGGILTREKTKET